MLRCAYWMPVFLVAVGITASAMAGGGAYSPRCCEQHYVEKTICCPTWVTETRVVQVCEYRREQRQREVTVYKCVPETKTVTRTECYTVREPRTRTCSYTVRKPVWREETREYTVRVPFCREEQQEYTVMVPHQETRSTTRIVCKRVNYTEMKTITVDEGCWETQTIEVPCKPCHTCHRKRCCGKCSCCDPCVPKTRTVCKRVWVPNCVEKQIECTKTKLVREEVPCEYTVTVCKPEIRTRTIQVQDCRTETRTRTVKLCSYETEERTREINYTVCVPKTREVECQVTCYKSVPETKTVSYTVCVPETVEKEIQVRVCKMVPKTIQVPVCCKHGRTHHQAKRSCGC